MFENDSFRSFVLLAKKLGGRRNRGKKWREGRRRIARSRENWMGLDGELSLWNI